MNNTMPADSDMEKSVIELCKRANDAAVILANTDSKTKNRWLLAMADALDRSAAPILTANAEDMAAGRAKGMSAAMQDRLQLTPERIKSMSDALRYVTTLEDPVGRTLETTVRPNGLRIAKVSVPMGVIGFIYESRPNVTADAVGLCLRSGNAVVLRGGSEAIRSNVEIARILTEAGVAVGMPDGAAQLIPFTGHDAVSVLLKQDRYVDLIIPRGGERLIRAVVEQSTIPVLKHYKGICHVYVDRAADQEMAMKIIENGKCQRPGVCNAVEKVLVHADIADEFLPKFAKLMKQQGVELRGDDTVCKILPEIKPCTEEDYGTEYLALILTVHIVNSVEDAVWHINHYGSGHSDAIITADAAAGDYFLNTVDSAAVYLNASTRFTDGGEFGMGAEIGISTDKLHARGPMGLRELTSYKYKIFGNGQIR